MVTKNVTDHKVNRKAWQQQNQRIGLILKGGLKIKKTTKLRLFGGLILLFNLWLIGRYNFSGIPVILMTFGFAFGFEFIVIRPISKADKSSD